MSEVGIYKKLLEIQTELKAPKGQYNSFGKYKYRSCEDILEAVKPICKKHNVTLIISDEIVSIGDNSSTTYTENYYDKDLKKENVRNVVTGGQRYYIKATATIIDIEDGSTLSNTSYAREEETKKGMDGSQITGTASSYARKYALNGLFCIDDTKDADTDEYKEQTEKDKIIDNKLVEGLNMAIEKSQIDQKAVELILNQYGYTNTAEIKMKDYMNIVNDFKNRKE